MHLVKSIVPSYIHNNKQINSPFAAHGGLWSSTCSVNGDSALASRINSINIRTAGTGRLDKGSSRVFPGGIVDLHVGIRDGLDLCALNVHSSVKYCTIPAVE